MSQKKQDETAWAAYWSTADSGGAAVRSSRVDAGFAAFWRAVFAERLAKPGVHRVMDLACGAGVVSRHALDIAKERGVGDLQLTVSDYSEAAVDHAVKALDDPRVTGVVADAANPPMDAGSADLVVSQFGIEYAGMKAIEAAWSLVAPGGALVALIHVEDGPIHTECAANLRVLEEMSAADLMPLTQSLINAARAGQGREAAEATLKAARARVRDAADAEPNGPAAEFAMRLLADSWILYQRHQAYAPQDIENWIAHQAREIDAYARRMQSMLDASRSREVLESVIESLGDWLDDTPVSPNLEGFRIDGDERACAWALRLLRTG